MMKIIKTKIIIIIMTLITIIIILITKPLSVNLKAAIRSKGTSCFL